MKEWLFLICVAVGVLVPPVNCEDQQIQHVIKKREAEEVIDLGLNSPLQRVKRENSLERMKREWSAEDPLQRVKREKRDAEQHSLERVKRGKRDVYDPMQRVKRERRNTVDHSLESVKREADNSLERVKREKRHAAEQSSAENVQLLRVKRDPEPSSEGALDRVKRHKRGAMEKREEHEGTVAQLDKVLSRKKRIDNVQVRETRKAKRRVHEQKKVALNDRKHKKAMEKDPAMHNGSKAKEALNHNGKSAGHKTHNKHRQARKLTEAHSPVTTKKESRDHHTQAHHMGHIVKRVLHRIILDDAKMKKRDHGHAVMQRATRDSTTHQRGKKIHKKPEAKEMAEHPLQRYKRFRRELDREVERQLNDLHGARMDRKQAVN